MPEETHRARAGAELGAAQFGQQSSPGMDIATGDQQFAHHRDTVTMMDDGERDQAASSREAGILEVVVGILIVTPAQVRAVLPERQALLSAAVVPQLVAAWWHAGVHMELRRMIVGLRPPRQLAIELPLRERAETRVRHAREDRQLEQGPQRPLQVEPAGVRLQLGRQLPVERARESRVRHGGRVRERHQRAATGRPQQFVGVSRHALEHALLPALGADDQVHTLERQFGLAVHGELERDAQVGADQLAVRVPARQRRERAAVGVGEEAPVPGRHGALLAEAGIEQLEHLVLVAGAVRHQRPRPLHRRPLTHAGGLTDDIRAACSLAGATKNVSTKPGRPSRRHDW